MTVHTEDNSYDAMLYIVCTNDSRADSHAFTCNLAPHLRTIHKMAQVTGNVDNKRDLIIYILPELETMKIINLEVMLF